MSNLGFQTVYRLFNAQDDVVCERVFLPPKQELAELVASKTPLLTLESQTPVGEFDVVAFSVSFEWDYVNVLTLLRLAGIPRYAEERGPHHPLVVVGGAVTFVNPEPLAPFADVVAAGEGEVLVPSLDRAFREATGRRRSAAPACRRARFLRAVVLRAAVRRRRHTDRLRRRTWRGRRADAGPQSRRPHHRRARSAGHEHLHAGDRVRIAVPRRSRARLREPVPVLLGRLQLPAGTLVSGRPDSAARRSGACARQPRRPRIHRLVRPPRDRADSRAAARDGLRHQPGFAAARRSHRTDRPDSPRRAASEASRLRPRRVRIGCGV